MIHHRMILDSAYFVFYLDDFPIHRWATRLANIVSSDGTIFTIRVIVSVTVYLDCEGRTDLAVMKISSCAGWQVMARMLSCDIVSSIIKNELKNSKLHCDRRKVDLARILWMVPRWTPEKRCHIWERRLKRLRYKKYKLELPHTVVPTHQIKYLLVAENSMAKMFP